MSGKRAAAVRYIPMDTVLSLPRIRILRALRHFDWVTAEEVRIALDVNDNEHEANTITKTFTRLVHERLLDRIGTIQPFRYRLNDAGRAELAAYLAKALVDHETARHLHRKQARSGRAEGATL